ncbi:MAG TPA: diguanylate cyclase [Stellaceae bacterium]|nr:diguanylate cyclase [Stellaceae bacterium]
MDSSEELQAAVKLGEAAFKTMADNAVPPRPRNYAVWYTYHSGVAPELKRAIDLITANGGTFTPEINSDLFSRFFDETGQIDLLQETGSRLTYIVDQVKRHLASAAGDANQFGRTLDDFSAAIGEGKAPDVRGLITDLISETQRVAERNRALEQRLNRAADEVSDLKLKFEHVQKEALTDALTGIPNRKSFDIRLRVAAREAEENDEPLSLLFADIDHFKRFNDTYGHQIGDQVLRLVARTLTDSVKGRDTPARYGGEEFAIILPQTHLSDARIVADKIREGLTRRRLVGRDKRDNYGSVTLSFGAAQYRPGETTAALVERTDAALYVAKRTGRNRVATEDMVEAVAEAS